MKFRHPDLLTIIAGAIILTAISSCDHKGLCFDHDSHALRAKTRFEITYNIQWETDPEGFPYWRDIWPTSFGMTYLSLMPAMPHGVCVNAYPEEGKSVTTHLPAGGGDAEITAGHNSLLFYNDDTEYIIFDDVNSSVSAKATTRTRTRSSYAGNPFYSSRQDVEERTVTPPDPLFGHYIQHYDQHRLAEIPVLAVTLQPLVFTYLVRYEFNHGLEHVGVARGAIAGMAESVYLHDGHTGPDRATILYDCSIESWGIQAIVNSFGVPDYPNTSYSRTEPGSYALNLEVRLRNGKILTFNFDITDQMRSQPHGGVIVVDGIEISDEEADQGGSGFDVSIDSWGEYDDIMITL